MKDTVPPTLSIVKPTAPTYNPADEAHWQTLAWAKDLAADPKAAIAALEQAIRLDPRNAAAHGTRAAAYLGPRYEQNDIENRLRAAGAVILEVGGL